MPTSLILALAVWLTPPSVSSGPGSEFGSGAQERSSLQQAASRSGILSSLTSQVASTAPPAASHSASQSTAVRASTESADDSSATAPSASPNALQVHFGGEVLKGQWFEHDIGHDLVFRLNPSEADETGGWVIEILPKTQPADGPAEFSSIATPPYHFYNDRYIEGVYGYSPREAVQFTTRKFYFVTSVAEQQIASDVVNAALYPSTSSDQEKARVVAESAGLNLARGELRIVHSHVTAGKAGASDGIASIKFEVSLDFSPGVTLQQILAPAPTKPARH